MIFVFIFFHFNQSVPPELLPHYPAITFIAPHYLWNIAAVKIQRRMVDVTAKLNTLGFYGLFLLLHFFEVVY